MLLELCRGAELDIGGCIEDREEKPLDLLDRNKINCILEFYIRRELVEQN